MSILFPCYLFFYCFFVSFSFSFFPQHCNKSTYKCTGLFLPGMQEDKQYKRSVWSFTILVQHENTFFFFFLFFFSFQNCKQILQEQFQCSLRPHGMKTPTLVFQNQTTPPLFSFIFFQKAAVPNFGSVRNLKLYFSQAAKRGVPLAMLNHKLVHMQRWRKCT